MRKILLFLVLASGVLFAGEEDITVSTDPDLCKIKVYKWVPFDDPRGPVIFETISPAIIPLNKVQELRGMVIEISKDGYPTIFQHYFPPFKTEYEYRLEKKEEPGAAKASPAPAPPVPAPTPQPQSSPAVKLAIAAGAVPARSFTPGNADCPPGLEVFTAADKYAKANDYDRAAEFYVAGIKKYPGAVEQTSRALVFLINYWQSVDGKTKIVFFDDLLSSVRSRPGTCIRYLFAMAEAFLAAGDIQAANGYYKQIAGAYPSEPEVAQMPYKIAMGYVNLENHEEAVIWFEKQLNISKTGDTARKSLYMKGSLYLRKLQNAGKAREAFEEYVKLFPNTEHTQNILLNLALCYEKAGESEKALKILKETLARNKDPVERRYIEQKISRLENKS